jgi:hypothetical protein
MSENRVLKRIFDPKREKLAVGKRNYTVSNFTIFA